MSLTKRIKKFYILSFLNLFYPPLIELWNPCYRLCYTVECDKLLTYLVYSWVVFPACWTRLPGRLYRGTNRFNQPWHLHGWLVVLAGSVRAIPLLDRVQYHGHHCTAVLAWWVLASYSKCDAGNVLWELCKVECEGIEIMGGTDLALSAPIMWVREWWRPSFSGQCYRSCQPFMSFWLLFESLH